MWTRSEREVGEGETENGKKKHFSASRSHPEKWFRLTLSEHALENKENASVNVNFFGLLACLSAHPAACVPVCLSSELTFGME